MGLGLLVMATIMSVRPMRRLVWLMAMTRLTVPNLIVIAGEKQCHKPETVFSKSNILLSFANSNTVKKYINKSVKRIEFRDHDVSFKLIRSRAS